MYDFGGSRPASRWSQAAPRGSPRQGFGAARNHGSAMPRFRAHGRVRSCRARRLPARAPANECILYVAYSLVNAIGVSPKRRHGARGGVAPGPAGGGAKPPENRRLFGPKLAPGPRLAGLVRAVSDAFLQVTPERCGRARHLAPGLLHPWHGGPCAGYADAPGALECGNAPHPGGCEAMTTDLGRGINRRRGSLRRARPHPRPRAAFGCAHASRRRGGGRTRAA